MAGAIVHRRASVAAERLDEPVLETEIIVIYNCGLSRPPYRSATATKTDTPLIEDPASVSIVTSEQIEAQQPKTVTQALRYTPGVTSEVAGGQRMHRPICASNGSL